MVECDCCGRVEASISLREKRKGNILSKTEVCRECGSILFKYHQLDAEIEALREAIAESEAVRAADAIRAESEVGRRIVQGETAG